MIPNPESTLEVQLLVSLALLFFNSPYKYLFIVEEGDTGF